MQAIEFFKIPDVPECTVEVPQGLKLIDCTVGSDDDIYVYYMDPRASDETVTLTWYVFGLAVNVPDAFAGTFYKRVEMSDGSQRFIFFKQNTKKRKPIVAKVPRAEPEKGSGDNGAAK